MSFSSSLALIVIVLVMLASDAMQPSPWPATPPTPRCLLCWVRGELPWVEKGGVCHWVEENRVVCPDANKLRIIGNPKDGYVMVNK